MKIPDSVIARIEQSVNIVDVISQYTTLVNRGGRYSGLCPFHTEKTPSFTVNPEKNLFYCFGCQKGGSVFTFLMEKENLSFPESVKMLAEKAGIPVSWEKEEAVNDEIQALYELYDKLSGTFHYLFKNSDMAKAAREYLIGRGISEEAVDDFKIGYCPEPSGWLYDFLKKKNYSPEFLAQSGLFSKKNAQYGLFHGRLLFPIHNIRSQCIGFGGRSLDNSEPKYLNSPETPIFKKKNQLFALNQALSAIREKGYFLLVEGYMDVIALHQAGWKNAIAPLGTSFTPEQAQLLKRYSSQGRLLFDMDKAGQAATEKALLVCEFHQIECGVINFEGGKDPAEILQKEGPQALNKLLEYNITGTEYICKVLVQRFGKETASQKVRCIAAARDYYNSLQSAVKKEDLVRKLAEELDVAENSVVRDIKSGREVRIAENDRTTGSQKPLLKGDLTREQVLMLALTANREYFSYARSFLNSDDLKDSSSRSLFYILEESFRNEDESEESFWERFDDPELKSAVIEHLTSGAYHVKDKTLVDDLLKQLEMEKISQERISVGKAIKAAQKSGIPDAEIRELLAQKMYLDSEFERLKVSVHDGTA